MKKLLNLSWLLFLVGTVTGQQLQHWPIYSEHSSTQGLSELSYSLTPPQTYTPLSYPVVPSGVDIISSNAHYDLSNNLVFYVVQTNDASGFSCSKNLVRTYFYDATGTLIPTCTQNDPCTQSSNNYVLAPPTTEINIIPLPYCGEGIFHVIAGNHLMVLDMRQKKVIYQNDYIGSAGINIGHGSLAHLYHSPTAVWVKDRNSYFVYFMTSNTSGGGGNALLHKVEISMNLCEAKRCADSWMHSMPEYSYNIGSSSLALGGAFTIFFPYGPGFNGGMNSEIELSADGKHLLFNDANKIFTLNFTDPNDPNISTSLDPANKFDLFPIPLMPSNSTYCISGLEYSVNNDYIYFTTFDQNTPGALPSGTPALYRVEIATGAQTSYPGTNEFARSQLEMGYDNNVYLLSENNIGYIDNTHTLATYAPFTAPDKILINPSTITAMPTSNFDIYTLPDQLDGQVFNSAYFNDPLIKIHNIVFCGYDNDPLTLTPDLIGCAPAGEFDNTITWYKNSIFSPAVHTGPFFTVPQPDIASHTPLTYIAVHIDAYGCIKFENFNITRPVYTIETQNIHLCYGAPLTINSPCSGGTIQWYESAVPNPGNPPAETYMFPDNQYVEASVTGNKTITSICRDANGCITRIITYNITVSPAPVAYGTTVYACEGDWVNPADHLPGWCYTGLVTIPTPMYTSNTFEYQCLDEFGCIVNYFYVQVVVTPPIMNEITIDIDCGTAIDFNLYNCSETGPNKWYMETPGGLVPIFTDFVMYIITQPGTYHCFSKNPCCSLTLHININPPNRIPITVEACEGDVVNLSSHLPSYVAEQHPLSVVTASVSTMYPFSYVSIIGCTTYYDINLIVHPRLVTMAAVEVDCGEGFDPSGYGCGGTNQWYIEDPVTHALTPIIMAFGSVTQPMTLHCVGTNPCCSLILEVLIREPIHQMMIPITVCEGDLIDLASYLPEGCHHTVVPGVVVATTSQVYAIPCIGENGCILYYIDLDVTVIPKQTIHRYIDVLCGDEIDLDEIGETGETCPGPIMWGVPDEQGNMMYLMSNQFVVTGDGTYYGFSSNPCCKLILHVNMVLPDPEVYEICNVSGQLLPGLCPPGTTTQWTKNGAPYPLSSFTGPGSYRVVCTDPVTGCIKADITFITREEDCPFQFRCYDEGEEISAPCPPGTFAYEWTKDGMPFSTGSSIVPSGRGLYVVKCYSSDGVLISTVSMFLYPCDEITFGPMQSSLKKNEADAHKLNVYPNPANDHFIVEHSIEHASKIEICDILGRIIYTRMLEDTDRKININSSEWNTGVYMIKIYTGSVETQTIKLIKSK